MTLERESAWCRECLQSQNPRPCLSQKWFWINFDRSSSCCGRLTKDNGRIDGLAARNVAGIAAKKESGFATGASAVIHLTIASRLPAKILRGAKRGRSAKCGKPRHPASSSWQSKPCLIPCFTGPVPTCRYPWVYVSWAPPCLARGEQKNLKKTQLSHTYSSSMLPVYFI